MSKVLFQNLSQLLEKSLNSEDSLWAIVFFVPSLPVQEDHIKILFNFFPMKIVSDLCVRACVNVRELVQCPESSVNNLSIFGK